MFYTFVQNQYDHYVIHLEMYDVVVKLVPEQLEHYLHFVWLGGTFSYIPDTVNPRPSYYTMNGQKKGIHFSTKITDFLVARSLRRKFVQV